MCCVPVLGIFLSFGAITRTMVSDKVTLALIQTDAVSEVSGDLYVRLASKRLKDLKSKSKTLEQV